MNFHNKTKGFTLIELLTVISIIGLLASIILASLSAARKKAQMAQVVQEFHQLSNAMELYKSDHNGQALYPLKISDINQAGGIFGGCGFHDFGNPDGVSVWCDDWNDGTVGGHPTDPYDALGPLVPKYISSIQKNPTLSNNSTHGMVFGYAVYPASLTKNTKDEYYACGSVLWGDYTFYVYDSWTYLNHGSKPDFDFTGLMSPVHQHIRQYGSNYSDDVINDWWCVTSS
jgi:prepilin-type N-terminal cleavage/methylation domain-containing protein